MSAAGSVGRRDFKIHPLAFKTHWSLKKSAKNIVGGLLKNVVKPNKRFRFYGISHHGDNEVSLRNKILTD